MSLLAPLALALGLTLPIVVIFYLLKVRRHDEEISSTFLWNDLIRDLAAHEPLQRLKWSLLLLLQLLALALITFAVARPFSEQTGQKPVQAVLLEGTYAHGIHVPDEEVQTWRLTRHPICPQWNYTIKPRGTLF